MKTFEELRTEIMEDLGDLDGNTWSEDFIGRAIDQAQKEIAKRTESLRTVSIITHRQNQSVYVYPKNHISILRVEDVNGKEIPRTTSTRLRETATNFRDSTTSDSPKAMYSDLSSPQTFEFYPRLNPTIDAPTLQFTSGTMVPQLHDPNARVIRVLDDQLYLLTTTALKIYAIRDDSLVLETEITHGKTLSTSFADMQIDTRPSSYGTVYFNPTGGLLSKIAPDGTVSDHLSGLATDIFSIYPMPPDGDTLLYTRDSLHRTTSKDGTPVESTFAVGLTQIVSDSCFHPTKQDTLYVALGTEGLVEIEVVKSPSVVQTITSNTVFACAAYNDGSNQRIYFYDGTDEELKYYDIDSGTITTYLDLTGNGSTFALTSDGKTNLYYPHLDFDVTRNERWKKLSLTGDDPTFYFSGPGFSLAGFDFRNVSSATHPKYLFFVSRIHQYVYMSATELGEITYLDGATFNQEAGIVTDLIGNENTLITINGDQGGAVNNLISSNTAATIWYSFYPEPGTLYYADTDAISEYVKYLCYRRRGTRQNLQLANSHKKSFQEDHIDYINSIQFKGGNNHQDGSVVY